MAPLLEALIGHHLGLGGSVESISARSAAPEGSACGGAVVCGNHLAHEIEGREPS